MTVGPGLSAGVDAVGPFGFAVQPRCAGLDADVADALVEQVPMEC